MATRIIEMDALKRMEAKGFKDTKHYKRLKYKLEMLEQGKAIKKDVTFECIAAAGAIMAAWTVFDGGRYHSNEEMIRATQEVVNRWKEEVKENDMA